MLEFTRVCQKSASDEASPTWYLEQENVRDLLDRLKPKFRRILSRASIPPEDAEDLVQETVLGWIQKRRTVRDPEAWLLAGLKFKCMAYWRGRRRCLYRAVDQALLDVVCEPSSRPDEDLERSQDFKKLLAQISVRCRSLLDLRYKWGLRPPEVAQRLGYRRSSISNITRRCLTALTRELVAVGYPCSSDHGRASKS